MVGLSGFSLLRTSSPLKFVESFGLRGGDARNGGKHSRRGTSLLKLNTGKLH